MNPSTVKQYIKSHGIIAELADHPEVDAMTTDGAKVATGAEADSIVKVLLFTDKNGNKAIVIIQGNKRVDERKIPGLKRADLATPQEVKKYIKGEIGGIAPIALPENIKKYVDEGIMQKEFIYGSGGSRFSSIKISPKFILEQPNSFVINLTKE